MKRGNLAQMTRDGADFTGSGAGNESMDTVKRATAAQMAGRKIKQPRSRMGGGGGFGNSGPRPGSGPSFQPAPSGADGSPFQGNSSSGGFNFSAPKQPNAPEVRFGELGSDGNPMNTSSGGYSGSLFSLPPGQSKTPMVDALTGTRGEPVNPTATPPTNQSFFNSTSNFNFGGSTNNPFAFGSQPQSNQTTSGSSTSNLFAASANSNTPAVQSSIFGGTTPASQAPSTFGQTTTSAVSNFSTQSQPPSSQAPRLFGSQNPTSQSQSLFPSTGSTNQTSGLFSQSSGNSQSTSSSNIFGSTGQGNKTQGPFSFGNNFGDAPKDANATSFSSKQEGKTDVDLTANAQNSAPAAAPGAFGTAAQNTTNSFQSSTLTGTTNASGQNSTSSNLFASASQKGGSNLFPTKPSENTAGSLFSPGSTPATNIFGASKSNQSTSLFPSANALSASNNQAPLEVHETSNQTSSKSLFDKQPSSTAVASQPFQANSEKQADTIFSDKVQNQAKEKGSGSWCPDPTDRDGGFWTPGKASPPNLFQRISQQQPQSTANKPSEEAGAPDASVVNPGVPEMSTLNSSAPPASVEQSFNSVLDVPVPQAPKHLTEKQKAQWPDAWRLKVLAATVKHHLLASNNNKVLGPEEILAFLLREADEIRVSLKRKAGGEIGEESAPKRVNRGKDSALSTSKSKDTPTSADPNIFIPGDSSMSAPKANAGSSLFGNSSTSKAAAAPLQNPEGPFAGPLFSVVKTGKPAAPISNPLFGFVDNGSRNSSENAEGNEAPSATKPFDFSKEPRTGDVAYPTLPAPSATSSNKDSSAAATAAGPPKFEMPKFGGGASNFMSQFGEQAKKAEAQAAEKRKLEDYDSEEEDLETWKKRDEEKRKAKQAEYETIAKDTSLGFKFQPKSTPADSSSTPSLFSKASSAAAPSTQPPSLFGASSTASKPDSEKAKKSLFSVTPSTTSDAANSIFTSTSPSVLPAAKPLPDSFSFSTATSAAPATSSIFGTTFTPSTSTAGNGLGTSLFSSSTPATGTIEPKGGLFDRIQKDKDDNQARESTDNTFKGDSGTPIKFSKTLPGSLAPPSVASDTSRATTPATGDETDGNAGDEETPKDEQLDLSSAAVGEEDEDVLTELRAKGSEMVKNKDGKAEWVVRGVGQLKLLRHKETRKTRVLLRSSPAAKVVLNTQLIPRTKYAASGAKGNTIRLPAVTPDGKIQQYALMVKEAKDAASLAAMMEENKSN